MKCRHSHSRKLGLIALVCLVCLVGAASSAQADEPEEADELGDLAAESDDKPAAESDEAESASSRQARAEQAGEAASAFAADSGVDAETLSKARSHFEQGVEFYAEGDYRAALIELQRAYELHRTYKLLYNLGQVAYELRDYAGAERYFRDYLAKGGNELSPERRREVKQELARLRNRLASLRVNTSQPGATIRVDDHVVVHPEGLVRVSAGRRVIRAEASGFSPVERVIDVTGGEELTVDLTFGPSLVAAGSDGTSKSSVGPLPWVTGIMSGALLIASGAVGWAAYQDISARDDALRTYTTRSELDSLGEQAHTKAIVADALLGAAVVSAAVTMVVVLTSGGKSDTKPPPTTALNRPAPTLLRF
ncbi:MAG TPA: PEGA domain-containing protein [Polyangiales bacterium]|nr:PEGA domain-containing protein [Polyangiales bacterium]